MCENFAILELNRDSSTPTCPFSYLYDFSSSNIQTNRQNILAFYYRDTQELHATYAPISLLKYLVSSSPPININVTALNSTAIRVEWNPPALIDQNGVLTSYQIQYRGVEIDTVVRTVNVSVDTFSLYINGLEAGSNYCVIIRVQNQMGFSEFSSDVCVRTQEVGMS